MRNLAITQNISSNGLEKRRQQIQHISHFPNGKEPLSLWGQARVFFNSIFLKKPSVVGPVIGGFSEDEGANKGRKGLYS